MDLYSPIFTRASTTKFEPTPLSNELLEEIEEFIGTIKPLLPNVRLSHRIMGPNDVKGMRLPNAPHFLIISGEANPHRNVCAGFLYQHVELFLYSKGLATRWLNSVKTKESDPNHVVGFAFGRPAAPATRTNFDRKPVSEIAKGTDSRFEAARTAPSGMNKQPWYYIVDGADIHAYYQKSLGGLLGMMYSLTDLDLGLSLCHLAVASEHEGKAFHFVTDRKDVPEAPKGFAYAGTVEGA